MNSKYLLIKKLLRIERFLEWAERNGMAHSRTIEKIVDEIKANGNYKSYQGARTARENIKLRQDVIDLKKAQGELIPVDQVKREADQVGRTLKDQLMSLKDRVSALVAPVTDEFEVKQIIGKEVEYTLRAISSRLSKHVS